MNYNTETSKMIYCTQWANAHWSRDSKGDDIKYYPEDNESTVFSYINALKLLTEVIKYIYCLITKRLQ